MRVGHKVSSYVHLAEGGDGQSRMCNILHVSARRRPDDDVQKLLGLVCAVCGQEHICGENHTVPSADVDRLYKDGNIS